MSVIEHPAVQPPSSGAREEAAQVAAEPASPLRNHAHSGTYGQSFAQELRTCLNDSAAIDSRDVLAHKVADKVLQLLDAFAGLSPADYRKVVGTIVDVRIKQGERNAMIDSVYRQYRHIADLSARADDAPNEHFAAVLRAEIPALREMADFRCDAAAAYSTMDVHKALKWDLAKWNMKQQGYRPPDGRVISNDVAEVYTLMLQLFDLCHSERPKDVPARNGYPRLPAALPDESFMTDMALIARLSYPGGINIFNAAGKAGKDNAFSINSTFKITTGGKTILIEPGGIVTYDPSPRKASPGGEETLDHAPEDLQAAAAGPKTLQLEDGKSLFFGRELPIGPYMLQGRLISAEHKFTPDGQFDGSERGVSRFAIEIMRRGDKVYVFDRASRNDVDFHVKRPKGPPVSGTYTSRVVQDEDGGIGFGHTQMSWDE